MVRLHAKLLKGFILLSCIKRVTLVARFLLLDRALPLHKEEAGIKTLSLARISNGVILDFFFR
jgi:hypothetical protein